MNCPHCGFAFKALAVNAKAIPDLAPIICESCAGVSLIVVGAIRKPSPEELRAIQSSPAWRDLLDPVRNLILSSYAPPADRTKTMLTDGSPVTVDHRTIQSDGMQKGYVVLTDEERARGFVRPLRDTYTHVGVRPTYPTRDLTDEEHERYARFGYVRYEEYPPDPDGSAVTGRFWTDAQLNSGCGTDTTMGLKIAETYARDPGFYNGTFCCHCRTHRPLEEFVWKGTEERVGS